MLSTALRRGLSRGLPATASKAVGVAAVRNFSASRDVVKQRLDRYHDELFGTNWGDYVETMQNAPFLEAELDQLNQAMSGFVGDAELKEKYEYCLQGTDAFYACEDVRDHINELFEVMTRSGGVMNIGLMAGEPLGNLEENAVKLADEYQSLLDTYPQMKPKIEQSVGHGLAIMRQKHKFAFRNAHRFHF